MQRWEANQKLRVHSKIVTGARSRVATKLPRARCDARHLSVDTSLRPSPTSHLSDTSWGSRTPKTHDRPPIRRSRTPDAEARKSGTINPSLIPLFSYLKLFGLTMYARRLYETSFGDLESLSRLSDRAALELSEQIKVIPGHKIKFLRAIDLLRRANAPHEEDNVDVFDRLWNEKERGEEQNQLLADENVGLYSQVQSQNDYIKELERHRNDLTNMIQDRTAQCDFLTRQLEVVMFMQQQRHGDSGSECDSNDWTCAAKIFIPEDALDRTQKARIEEVFDESEQKAYKICALLNGTVSSLRPATRETSTAPTTANTSRVPSVATGTPTKTPHESLSSSPISERREPKEAKLHQQLGKSLDSANVTDCLSEFDVDHLLRCLAKAIQNDIILSMVSPRPHTAPESVLQQCSVFLESLSLKKLESLKDVNKENGVSWLNDIALRRTPNLDKVYAYLCDIMTNFKLEQECAVITLIYLKRFIQASKIALTPDSWQRLIITAMILASKVWDDESYENSDFAQFCPLYTVEQLSNFEKNFLQCVGYDMSVKASEYARAYFLLRTIGAKDLGDFDIPPQLEPEVCSKLKDKALAKQMEFKTRYISEGDPKNWTL